MTSRVKQALPQVSIPRIEGKVAGNRTQHGNFAETLGIGKLAAKIKSGEAKADHQQVEARPAWPQMAAKLDTAIDRTHGIAPKLEVVQSKLSNEDDDTADDELPVVVKEGSTEDTPPPAIPRLVAEPTQVATGATTPAAVPMPTAETKQARSSAPAVSAIGDELPAPVARDVLASGQEAPLKDVANKPTSEMGQPTLPPFVLMGRSEQSAPTSFEPASKPIHAAAEQPMIDAAKAKETPADALAEPAKTTPRITVLAQQNIPAPMPSTAAVLVESIAASSLLEPAASRPAVDAIHASATHASAQSLKIQLHPAELGMVTATLRFTGEQLSIELQVENHEAYRRLSSDSEVIVKSLRDLGYDIERVSVLQPSIASPGASRSEGAAMQALQGRASDQFGSGMAGGGNSGANGRQPGTDGGTAGHDSQLRPSTRTDPATSGGVYI